MSTPGAESDLATVDLSQAAWRKSSCSGGNGSGVDVTDLGAYIAVRDSRNRGGPKLIFIREAWRNS